MTRSSSRRFGELIRRIPLTEAGWAVLIGSVGTFVLAWVLGWLELGLVSVGGFIALGVGILYVLRRYRLTMTRTIEPQKVTVGEPAFGLLNVQNPRAVPSLPVRVEDKVGEAIVPIDLPALGPGRKHETLYQLPTDRRGVLDVGPVVIARTDPLRLYRSEVGHSGTDQLWIHPRYQVLKALPTGFAKDFEGPTSESSPKGDVTFHALREYVYGDDYRHIHWRSSARLGTLMVRQYVDNRLPQTTVVVDPSAESYTNGDYEVGVEVAASIGVSSIRVNHPVVLFHGDEMIAGTPFGSTTDGILDALSLIQMGDADGSELMLAAALQRAPGSSVLVYITGPIDAETLLVRTARVVDRARVVVVRCWAGTERQHGFLPRAKIIDINETKEFKASWNRIAS